MGLWGGRFSEPTDQDLKELNDSIGFDVRLWRQDIAGSIAYARAIHDAGVITEDEMGVIIEGLKNVHAEFESGSFELKAGDEDIHTAVERRLTELIGATGGKLHTGRSRNDQIATDLRLWVIDAIDELENALRAFQSAVIKQAEQHLDTLLPGYTHLQPAQPISAAHWLMSFFWMIQRDVERLQDMKKRVRVSPLGSGALAGHSFGLNREKLAKELGFDSHSQNSLDAVSDRDFVAEMLFAIALIGTHQSRLAEDIIIYSNPRFGFITLNDRYSTGSSLMPQKRNADPMELARGKVGRFVGNLTTLLTVLKGIPSTYNKDLQEDKEALFDSFDHIMKILPVITAIIETLQLNTDSMRDALQDDMLATDLADYLVRRGMPFREAHHVVGRVVRLASENHCSIRDLNVRDLRAINELFDDNVAAVFDFDQSVSLKSADGGTARVAVEKQIATAKALISSE